MGSLTKEEEKSPKILEECEFIWTICKFTEICHKYTTRWLYSSVFPKANSKYKWKLMLLPRRFDEKTFELSLAITIAKGGDYKIPSECTFIVKNSKNKILYTKKYSSKTPQLVHCAINREKLINSLLEHDDCFQIHVSILVETSRSEPLCTLCKERDTLQNEKHSVMKLSHDLRTLFQSTKFSDFVIKFEDANDILVHKTILTARSPVFSAMFKHDTSENKSGFVKISDIDKNTMECLLCFVYTGCIEGISVDEAKKLLFAADKYDIQDLKNLCAETLLQNLDTSNALDIWQLAELHYLVELKDSTAQYILEHLEIISAPKDFRDIENNFPGLMTERVIMAKSNK